MAKVFAYEAIDSSVIDRTTQVSSAAIGKTISDVEFEGFSVRADDVEDRLGNLEGKALSRDLIRNELKFLASLVGTARIDVSVRESLASVVLKFHLKRRKQIRRIQILGAEEFDRAKLKSKIVLREGDEYNEKYLGNSVERLEDFMSTKGYFNAEIKMAFSHGVLKVNIAKGKPTKITKISFSDFNFIEDKQLKKKMTRNLRKSFSLFEGDSLEQSKIEEGIKKIKDWLAEHDFLISQDPVVNTIFVDGLVHAHLDINIDYGPRIRYGFRNNKRYSYRELKSFVREVREIGIGADYLDTVNDHITKKYHKAGLVNVNIETVIREDIGSGYRNVTLVITEGKRVRINSIKFEGLYARSQEEIRDKFDDLAPRLVQREYFLDDGVRKTGELLAEHWRSLGFLLAKLDLVKLKFDEKRTKVDVVLFYTEGVQTFVDQIAVSGVKNLSEAEVVQLLGLRTGDPFNVFRFEEGLSKLKTAYKNLGHLKVRFATDSASKVVFYNADFSKVNIKLEMIEGPVIRVGEIIVSGNTKTHARVITREMPFARNDILTAPLFKEAQDNLRRLNIFSSIIIKAIDNPAVADVQDVVIIVEEGSPGLVEFGPGFRNDLGLRFFVSAAYENLGGWNRSIRSQFVVNRRTETGFFEYNFNVGFREPYFLNWPVESLTNLSVFKRRFTSLIATVERVSTAFKRRLSTSFTGSVQYSFERVKTVAIDRTKDDEFTDTNFIGSITPGIDYDSRDDKFNPSSGFYSLNRFEWADPIWGSQTEVPNGVRSEISYNRFTSYNRKYISLGQGVIWSSAANYGFVRSNTAGSPIPILKQFRLGGTSTIRGYKEDAIDLNPNISLTGVLSFVNLRNEVQVPLGGDLALALFVDGGNLFVDKIEKFQLRYSTGVGLRYKTPVGPVSLDYAHKVGGDPANPTALNASLVPEEKVRIQDEDDHRIHFAIGGF